jgi:hypothetical protein
MFNRKKKPATAGGDIEYVKAETWQQAVLGKRIVAMDMSGIMLFEDGTALNLKSDWNTHAGEGYIHRQEWTEFEFWSREKTVEHYRVAIARHAQSVASEIADKQRVETLIARVFPPLF